MNNIEEYGWNSFFQNYYNECKSNDFEFGRIISIQGFKYVLITKAGETAAELSGKILYGAETSKLPVVGDWVFFIRYESTGYIVELLPRMNELSRRKSGPKTEMQVLAANIDYALIVQGLDRDFNLMRLERYIVQITVCNIQPVIVLNKADLIIDQEKYRQEVEKLGRKYPVYFCSTYKKSGITELKEKVLKANKTYILVGSSGVGKSSLLNVLMEDDVRNTGLLSESTGKGRHITVTRDLFRLIGGSLIIDTPGMREFGLTFKDDQPVTGLFPLIEKLSEDCRFADCRHVNEEGCAVIEAYETGVLESKVYESYLKLIKEQKHFKISTEEKKRIGKRFGKMVREARDYRKKYKF